ncbi:Thioredoxin reductase [Clostridium thermopalmarium DSM 5974]|uniref:Thioredoxin reductase n=3 Tax=Clostridiaceae TaxID=31979 RepID=A0A151AKU0_9CLOT|nr:thioredoxin reductase [Clostridium colicanis DSM 13634]PRR76554.1 Thioredoxin reductase [Clostridium thermopalmarium DSM 5974]PVZ28333.1 thioredoxin reductase (NADPH) [Clostridium thermopalmarium DSM 5974]
MLNMSKQTEELDLVIIGSGPAGLTASIYATRAKLNSIVLENEVIGGQIIGTYTIENYPGFTTIGGAELAEKMHNHAINLGGKIDEFDPIVSVKLSDDEKIIETENKIYKPKTVIIATGSRARRLPIPEEGKFHGNGIHYCELCDAAMYEEKDVVAVGGGNSALEGIIFLAKYAKSITVVHQFDHFQGNKSNQDTVLNNPKVKIIWNSEVRHAIGENKLEAISIENTQTKEISEIKTDGVFVFIGRTPATDLFKNTIALNEWGYILTDENMRTNIKGVYAAGDVRDKMFRQITTAIADGTIAALMAERFITKKED